MSTIRCPVSEAADTSQHEPAIITGNRQIIYSEYEQFVRATADKLVGAGLAEGDRMALLLPPHWHAVVLVMAILRMRGVVCLADPASDGPALGRALKSIGCSCAVVPTGAARPALEGIRLFESDDLVTYFTDRGQGDERPVLDLERVATILVKPDGPAGRAAIVHRVGSHYYSARGSNHAVRSSSHNRWLLTDPLHHMNSLAVIFRCAVGAATLVIPAPGQPFGETVNAYRVSHASLRVEDLERLLKSRFAMDKHPSLRAVVVTGAGLSGALLDRACKRGIPVIPSYGLAEMASQVTVLTPGTPPSGHHSSGSVLMYRELRLAADGEILVKGPTLFDGYIADGKIRRELDDGGWFATGDLGVLGSDGCLTVTGRKPRRPGRA